MDQYEVYLFNQLKSIAEEVQLEGKNDDSLYFFYLERLNELHTYSNKYKELVNQAS